MKLKFLLFLPLLSLFYACASPDYSVKFDPPGCSLTIPGHWIAAPEIKALPDYPEFYRDDYRYFIPKVIASDTTYAIYAKFSSISTDLPFAPRRYEEFKAELIKNFPAAPGGKPFPYREELIDNVPVLIYAFADPIDKSVSLFASYYTPKRIYSLNLVTNSEDFKHNKALYGEFMRSLRIDDKTIPGRLKARRFDSTDESAPATQPARKSPLIR